MRTLLFPPNQPAQSVRLLRTLLALAFYVLCGLVIGFGVWQGLYPPFPFAVFTVGFITVSIAFFLVIRLGWNLRFNDPSLTEAQIVCSALLCSYTLIYAESLRGVFMFAYVIGLMFGGSQVMPWQLSRLAVLPVILFPSAAFISACQFHAVFDWRIEFIRWISLCVIMMFTAMLIANLASLRDSSIRELIEQADQALYRAKHAGRNRIVKARPAQECVVS